jgi:hypothetical protein
MAIDTPRRSLTEARGLMDGLRMVDEEMLMLKRKFDQHDLLETVERLVGR